MPHIGRRVLRKTRNRWRKAVFDGKKGPESTILCRFSEVRQGISSGFGGPAAGDLALGLLELPIQRPALLRKAHRSLELVPWATKRGRNGNVFVSLWAAVYTKSDQGCATWRCIELLPFGAVVACNLVGCLALPGRVILVGCVFATAPLRHSVISIALACLCVLYLTRCDPTPPSYHLQDLPHARFVFSILFWHVWRGNVNHGLRQRHSHHALLFPNAYQKVLPYMSVGLRASLPGALECRQKMFR